MWSVISLYSTALQYLSGSARVPESLGQRDSGALTFVSNALAVEHVKHTQLLVLTYAFFCFLYWFL